MLRALRRPALLAVVAGALAVTVLGPPAASAAEPSRTPLQLTLSGTASYRSIITRLDRDLYTPSFASVFNTASQTEDLNRQLVICGPNALAGIQASVIDSWCWESDDAGTHDWIPQGVTGLSDGAEDETWGSEPQKPIIVTWYSRTDDKGVRITIIDPATRRYRHVLLVEPWTNKSGNASYRPVDVHAGGIAWYGRYLYVPDTRVGVRVFDLDHVFDLNPLGGGHRTQTADTDADTDDKAQIGRHDGVYYGYGYRYLVPQTATWTQAVPAPTGSCAAGDDSQGMRFSYLTVDRGGLDTLAGGEYCDSGSTTNGRMAAWPLSAVHQSTINGADGTKVSPSTAWALPSKQTPGVAHAGSNWYFSVSHACSPSTLLVRGRGTGGWTGTVNRTAGIGSEDLYVWRSKSKIFSVTENAEVHWTCSPQPGRALYSLSL
jgi:hypothetical protein